MTSEWVPAKVDGENIYFDIPYTEADDVDTTSWLFDLFSSTVGA
jgi:hypothetical protein